MNAYRSSGLGVLGFIAGVSPDLMSGLAAIASVILAWVWFEGRMKKAIDEANAARDKLYEERWKAREETEKQKWQNVNEQLQAVHDTIKQLYSVVPKRKED